MKIKTVIVVGLLSALSLLLSACATTTAPAAPPAPAAMTLPSGAEKRSEIVPRMGEHWSVAGQDTIYLVHEGKVIGVEWVLPVPDVAKATSLRNLAVGQKVDHIEVGFDPIGTRGSTVLEASVHAYFITAAERDKIQRPPAP